jgi:RNA polymerase sporulation-specific sigma factor
MNMKDYENIIKQIKDKDDAAFKTLLEDHYKMIYKIIYSLNSFENDFAFDIESLYQEGSIALYKAVFTYEADRGMSFSSYAYMCIRSRLLVCYRNMRKYREEEIYSIDNHPNIDYCLSMASSCVSENPIAYHHTKEFNEDIGTFVSKLSKEDQEIFRMRVEKYSYKQIAEKLNISTKRIDNRLRKLRENLRKHLNEGY